MRKSARSDAARDKRTRAKEARRKARAIHAKECQQRRTQRRLAEFRVSARREIRAATMALLEGAAAAGVRITAEDISGTIDSEGRGKLRLDDRVSPNDVKAALAHAREIAALKAQRAKERQVREALEQPPREYNHVRSARGKLTHVLKRGQARSLCGQVLTHPYRDPTDEKCERCAKAWEKITNAGH